MSLERTAMYIPVLSFGHPKGYGIIYNVLYTYRHRQREQINRVKKQIIRQLADLRIQLRGRCIKSLLYIT